MSAFFRDLSRNRTFPARGRPGIYNTTASKHPSEIPDDINIGSCIRPNRAKALRQDLVLGSPAEVTTYLRAKHKIEKAAEAKRCFELRFSPVTQGDDYAVRCLEACHEVLGLDGGIEGGAEGFGERSEVGEAIQARCRMMLSRVELGEIVGHRWFHANEAMKLWGIVVRRIGRSRLPFELARRERAEAILLMADMIRDHPTAGRDYIADRRS